MEPRPLSLDSQGLADHFGGAFAMSSRSGHSAYIVA